MEEAVGEKRAFWENKSGWDVVGYVCVGARPNRNFEVCPS